MLKKRCLLLPGTLRALAHFDAILNVGNLPQCLREPSSGVRRREISGVCTTASNKGLLSLAVGKVQGTLCS